jgi:hypothetical protein
MEKAFQLKMNLMEQKYQGNSDALQKEIKALKEKLARAQPDMENTISSDLNSTSSNNENDNGDEINYNPGCTNSKGDDDDINAASKLTVMEGGIDALQKERDALKQKEREQHEENQRLKERLARMEAAMQNNADNDLNYDSSDNESNGNNAVDNASVKKNNAYALQKDVAALKQRECDHQKENQRLKERLARIEEEMQNNADNDLNYDSSDNESNDNRATNNVGIKKNGDYNLQKDISALKQMELEQHEENQLLKERLTRMEQGVQDDPNNDPNYDSSDNEIDNGLDINYDSECSNNKEDNVNKNIANTQQRESHHHLVETYADPNYDSSDNEDPRNDIYLD